jgi:hypothetical protein
MKFSLVIYPILLLALSNCSDPRSSPGLVSNDSTNNKIGSSLQISEKYSIPWLDSNRADLKIDSSLSHAAGFNCDSAIAVDYIGFKGEHTFPVINEKGQWISTIKKVEKLTTSQFQSIQRTLGNKSSFQNPIQVACYEPRWGLLYFKNGEVIGQTEICLACMKIGSSAKLGNNDQFASFNKKTLRKLQAICVQLGFSECIHWRD